MSLFLRQRNQPTQTLISSDYGGW